MNTFKKTPLILSILFFVILSISLFFLYRKINSNNESAALSTMEFNDETARREEVRLLNNSIETIKEDKLSLERHFAESSDIVPFLDTIEGLGLKVNVKAETTSVDILPSGGGLRVKINTSGDFANIYKFLTLLENSPYEIEVLGMDIQKEISGDMNADATLIKSSTWQAVFDIKLVSFIQ